MHLLRPSLLLLLLLANMLPAVAVRAAQEDYESVQAFLDAQPGPLKNYRENDQTAAMLIASQADYYGLSTRLYLALLEANGGLLSLPNPASSALVQPFGTAGPRGFGAQVAWASRELRAGLGPYERPPVVQFSDGTTLTLTLQQAPEGVAVQRFLAQGRDEAQWRAVVERFGRAFAAYFNNELPSAAAIPPLGQGFLVQPWPEGTQVRHLAYFDHAFPTVDSGGSGNGRMVDYLGRSGGEYDSHDGHDYVFIDQPIGTPILAAAAGVAYARTVRGNGVVIEHPGGYETVYWHLDSFAPAFAGRLNSDRGVTVRAGDLLGTSGRSGFTQGTPHLHFEVRRGGREVDPYGWYGPGPDPCLAYAGCADSVWLWQENLRGTYDFTPPDATKIADSEGPLVTLTANPRPELLLLTRLDGHAVQEVGQGFAQVEGEVTYRPGRVGQAVLLPPGSGLSYPVAGNLRAEAGTLSLWAELPADYAPNKRGRHYLLATSASPVGSIVATGTLALRREEDVGGRWNLWTVDDDGVADSLQVPDTLAPGWHHFAISWDVAAGSKALFIDGRQVAVRTGVKLAAALGSRVELGRFAGDEGYSGAAFDELAVFRQPLGPQEIAALAAAQGPVVASAGPLRQRELLLDVNGADTSGIMAVQLGLDGRWEAPQPYYDSYRWSVPVVSSTVTVGARFFDRASNSTTISTSLSINLNQGLYLPLVMRR